MITFENRIAADIKIDDIMRQADEYKHRTDFYHYRAIRVFKGDLAIPVHDLEGNYIGDRIDKDIVMIDWIPLEQGKPFSMKYHPNAIIEIARESVTDTAKFLATEFHAEE